MFDIENHLRTLAKERPLFHSEADFQHALAWVIHRELKDADIRLEYPMRGKDKERSEYLDMRVTYAGKDIALELKYKTRGYSHEHNNELFDLKNQSAQDIGRYDFLADVARIERFITSRKASRGYAILLTNDPSYWTAPSRADTVDAQFRLAEGKKVLGSLAWGAKASEGTMHNRKEPISLRQQYTAIWQPYSKLSEKSGGDFKLLVWRIENI